MPALVNLVSFPTSVTQSNADATHPLSNETRWQQMGARLATSGVWSGQRNGFEVYADSTGLQVKVRTGEAWVAGTYAEMTSESIVTVANASTANPRIDAVVLQLNVSSPSTVQLTTIQGSPASTPLRPVIPTDVVPLAYVRVGTSATTITASNVTDGRIYAGGYVNAPKIYNVGTAYNDIGTVAFSSGWNNLDASNYQAASFWKANNGVVHIRGAVTGPNFTPAFVLPTGFRPLRREDFVVLGAVNGGAEGLCSVIIDAGGQVIPRGIFSGSANIFNLTNLSFMAGR